MVLLAYACLILMGMLLGMIGGGGSILVVPILVYLFQLEVQLSTTYSLFIVGVTAFMGAAMKARKSDVDWKTGFFFALPSFVGIYLVRGYILPWIPQQIHFGELFVFSKNSLIMTFFAAIMVFSARSMIVNKPIEPMPKKTSPLAVVWRGFLVGGVTGFVGVGGGFLIIPALVLFLQMPMAKAVGTSLAIISVNSLFGFFVGLGKVQPDYTFLFKIIIISLVGLLLGLSIADRIPEKRLKIFFGYFVLVLGFFILIKNFI